MNSRYELLKKTTHNYNGDISNPFRGHCQTKQLETSVTITTNRLGEIDTYTIRLSIELDCKHNLIRPERHAIVVHSCVRVNTRQQNLQLLHLKAWEDFKVQINHVILTNCFHNTLFSRNTKGPHRQDAI